MQPNTRQLKTAAALIEKISYHRFTPAGVTFRATFHTGEKSLTFLNGMLRLSVSVNHIVRQEYLIGRSGAAWLHYSMYINTPFVKRDCN